MLDVMRRRKRLKLILWIVIIGLAAGMVILFVPNPGQTDGSAANDELARVDGEPIRTQEFRRAYGQMVETYTRLYNLNASNAGLLQSLGIDKMVLNQLINEKVLLRLADQMGINASVEEIQRTIQSYPAFQDKGAFIGLTRYEQILRANNTTPAEFEEGIRKDLIRDKLQKILSDGITISDADVRAEYIKRNQEASIRYFAIDPTEMGKSIQPTDAELQAFFDKNKERYKTPERRRARYLLVDRAALASQVAVDEAQLRALFAADPGSEQIRASHILFSVPDPSKEGEVRAKAEAVLKEIRAGGDLAALARKHSQDPSNAANGGDLGYFARGIMTPAFENVAFSLKQGQVSDLVRTEFGFHIIRLTDRKTPTFQDRRPELEQRVRQEGATRLAQNRANKALYEIKSAGKTFEQVSKEMGLQILETPLFGINEPPPQFGGQSGFAGDVFNLAKDAVGTRHDSPAGIVIPQVLEIRPGQLPALAEVRDRVLADYRNERSGEVARRRADDLAAAAKSTSFDAATRSAGVTVVSTKPFKADAPVDPTIGASPEIGNQVAKLKVGEVGGPVQAGQKFVVFVVQSKSTVDETALAAQKAEVREQLASGKRAAFVSAYITSASDRLKAENKLVVNQALLDDLTGARRKQ